MVLSPFEYGFIVVKRGGVKRGGGLVMDAVGCWDGRVGWLVFCGGVSS